MGDSTQSTRTSYRHSFNSRERALQDVVAILLSSIDALMLVRCIQVEELRQYLERCVVTPSPSDAGTPPEVLQEIVRRTGEAMASCMQALNLGGLKLQHLTDAIETRCDPSALMHAPICSSMSQNLAVALHSGAPYCHRWASSLSPERARRNAHVV